MNSNKEKKTSILELAVIVIVVFGIFIWILDIHHSEKYTVSFHSVGGTYITSTRVLANQKIEEPITPKKEGYAFLGWYNGDTIFDFNTGITSNLNLEAKWQKKEELEQSPNIKDIRIGETVRIGVGLNTEKLYENERK